MSFRGCKFCTLQINNIDAQDGGNLSPYCAKCNSNSRSLYLWYVETQVEQHLCGEDNTEVTLSSTPDNFNLFATM